MAKETGIQWTDHTFNPWWGCEKVSPGCAHCYAEGVAERYHGPIWGPGHDFRFFGDSHWNEPLRWNRASERDATTGTGLKRRHRVFCASMADVFEDRPELEVHRRRLFRMIEETPFLDWQVLTKRPEFARDWLHSYYQEWSDEMNSALWLAQGWVLRDELEWGTLPNLWIGVSIENARFTWRAEVLREIPAAVRFISAEPLLGPLIGVTVSEFIDFRDDPPRSIGVKKPLDLTGIDWVIVGGESGPKARPMHPDWAREIRDACACRCDPLPEPCDCDHPAFFFKQWGQFEPLIGHMPPGQRNIYVLIDGHAEPWYGSMHGSVTRWGEQARDSRGNALLLRVAKKAAECDLDGCAWAEFPRSHDLTPAVGGNA